MAAVWKQPDGHSLVTVYDAGTCIKTTEILVSAVVVNVSVSPDSVCLLEWANDVFTCSVYGTTEQAGVFMGSVVIPTSFRPYKVTYNPLMNNEFVIVGEKCVLVNSTINQTLSMTAELTCPLSSDELITSCN